MDKKIYVVTSGEYSDEFKVDRVFSTHEKALAWIGGANITYRIQEFDLDDETCPNSQTTYVSMGLKTGAILRVSEELNTKSQISILPDFSCPQRGELVFSISCPTGNPDTAVDICKEKRAQMIALNRTEPGQYDYEILNKL
jgi:hypothetical protein